MHEFSSHTGICVAAAAEEVRRLKTLLESEREQFRSALEDKDASLEEEREVLRSQLDEAMSEISTLRQDLYDVKSK